MPTTPRLEEIARHFDDAASFAEDLEVTGERYYQIALAAKDLLDVIARAARVEPAGSPVVASLETALDDMMPRLDELKRECEHAIETDDPSEYAGDDGEHCITGAV